MATFNTRGGACYDLYCHFFPSVRIGLAEGGGVSPPRGSARIIGFSPANLTRRQKGQMETRPWLARRA